MTQLMLFDTPATEPATISAVDHARNSQSGNAVDVAQAIRPQAGLNHMGDLARLVLLRYELVAHRRAVLAARKAERESRKS